MDPWGAAELTVVKFCRHAAGGSPDPSELARPTFRFHAFALIRTDGGPPPLVWRTASQSVGTARKGLNRVWWGMNSSHWANHVRLAEEGVRDRASDGIMGLLRKKTRGPVLAMRCRPALQVLLGRHPCQ
jgi:hypothetical protein